LRHRIVELSLLTLTDRLKGGLAASGQQGMEFTGLPRIP